MVGAKPRRARGDGSLYKRASDGLWMATVELPAGADGKRRRRFVTGKARANVVAKLRQMRTSVAEHGDLPTASMTTGAWLAYWMENVAAPRLRPNSLEQYRSDLKLHIVPEVGAVRLDRLSPRQVRDMGRAITAKGRSSTTALRCHRVLSKALKDAVREGHVTRNVAEHVDNPVRAVATRGFLSAEQAMRLLRAVAHDHEAASRWGAALMTGARQGELLGLQWSRTDLDAGLLDLSWQLQRLKYMHGCAAEAGAGCGRNPGWCPRKALEVPAGYELARLRGGLCLVRPKTSTGHRIVPLAPPLLAALRTHAASQAASQVPNPHNLVWATGTGAPIDAPRDSEAWRVLLERLELPKVELHGARHTAATLLMELRVDPHVIAAILGHSDIATTRMYQHVDQRLAREAVGQLGAALTGT